MSQYVAIFETPPAQGKEHFQRLNDVPVRSVPNDFYRSHATNADYMNTYARTNDETNRPYFANAPTSSPEVVPSAAPVASPSVVSPPVVSPQAINVPVVSPPVAPKASPSPRVTFAPNVPVATLKPTVRQPKPILRRPMISPLKV